MRNLFLLMLAVVLFTLSGCLHAPDDNTVPRAMVIDVRTRLEWSKGHLEGAVLIPHDKIEQGIAAVAPDMKGRIYLYCRTGRRTALAYDVLKKAGYEDLVNLGTMENASKELNLPIVK